MRRRLDGRHRCSAFTLVELLVSGGLVGIVGGLMVLCLLLGLNLFGKNIATNLPAQSSRIAFDLLQRDVHLAVGAPQLLDDSLADVAGPGPAAGVALRYYAGGPCLVATDAAPTATSLEVTQLAGFTPLPGDLLSLPAFRLERHVTMVGNAGSRWQLSLDAPVGVSITGTSTSNFIAFFTRRAAYAVVGGELRRYPNLAQPGVFHVTSRRVTSPTPFSIPIVSGLPDNRSLRVGLSVTEPSTQARAWASTDANLSFTLSCRTTLTTE
ncbi:MAG: hypothetical protein QOE70_3112 [Chthoniobacter sp.]|jgi:hypothetical protein|nr:hypothetical protein [Chthoniobacter sp.]